MNIYNINSDKFLDNLIKFNLETDTLELFEYSNEKEKECLYSYISAVQQNPNNHQLLDKLYSHIEGEVIFKQIWSMDEDKLKTNILNFDLSSVYGISFFHEFIKNLQSRFEYKYFDVLREILFLKYFKSKDKAISYFDKMSSMETKYINNKGMKNQAEKFIKLFDTL